jgi:hypothetical protein
MTQKLASLAVVGLWLWMITAAPGCVTKPLVTVHHAEVRGLSPGGLGMLVFLEVRNENSYDVQIRNVHVDVAFGRGYGLGPIDYAPNQWLPAKQTTLVPVPLAIPWALVPVLVGETVGTYAIPYHVKGSADVTATQWGKFERDNYPVDENGSVPRQMVVDAARNAIPLPLL